MNLEQERREAEAFLAGLPEVAESALIGSAMYLPPETVADVDYAVLVHGTDYVQPLTRLMLDHGFAGCGEQYEASTGTWGAVRRGNLNLMVTHDRAFYESYKLAMEVCKALRLENKLDRIAVCKVVRDRLPADIVRNTLYGEAA